MNNTFKRLSVLGLLMLLCTVYAQGPFEDSDDIVSAEMSEELIVPEDIDEQGLGFTLGADEGDEFALGGEAVSEQDSVYAEATPDMEDELIGQAVEELVNGALGMDETKTKKEKGYSRR